MKKTRRGRSQPRITGVRREFKVTGLHPDVEAAFQDIADAEGKSFSWVVAEVVSDAVGIDAATGQVRARHHRRAS